MRHGGVLSLLHRATVPQFPIFDITCRRSSLNARKRTSTGEHLSAVEVRSPLPGLARAPITAASDSSDGTGSICIEQCSRGQPAARSWPVNESVDHCDQDIDHRLLFWRRDLLRDWLSRNS